MASILTSILLWAAAVVLGGLVLLGPELKGEHGRGGYAISLLSGAGFILLVHLVHFSLLISWLVFIGMLLGGLYYLLLAILEMDLDLTFRRGAPFGIPALAYIGAAVSVGIRRGVFLSLQAFWAKHGQYVLWFLLGVLAILLWKIRRALGRIIRDQFAAFRRNREFRKAAQKLSPGGRQEYGIKALYEGGFIEVRVSGSNSSPGAETSNYPPFHAEVSVRNLLGRPIRVVVPVGTIVRSGHRENPHMIVIAEREAEIRPDKRFELDVVVAYLRGKGTLPTNHFRLAGIETAGRRWRQFIKKLAAEKGLEELIGPKKNYPRWLATMTSLQAGLWMMALAFDGSQIRKGLRELRRYYETLDFHENVEGGYQELGLEISDGQLAEVREIVESLPGSS